MYADYVAYAADKAVLWGGHSGDLRRLEEFFPVVRRPLEHFIERYSLDYLVLDLAYSTPERLHLEPPAAPIGRFGSIAVYQATALVRLEEPTSAEVG
jgi:hypothetical protein